MHHPLHNPNESTFLDVKNTDIKIRTRFTTKTIKPETLIHFTQQLAVLFSAGLSLSDALNTLKQHNNKINIILEWIAIDISQGKSLSYAMSRHPRCFDKFYINMIHIGETAGTLNHILTILTQLLSKKNDLKKKIRTALLYPALIMTVAITVLWLLMTQVIPRFETLFVDMDIMLPPLTQTIINLSKFFSAQWHTLFLTTLIAGFFLKFGYSHSDFLKTVLDQIIISTPVLGPFLKTAYHGQFSRILAMLYQSGIPMKQSLQLLQKLFNNTIYIRAIEKASIAVAEGHSLNQSLQQQHIFPTLMVQMIATAEKTGKTETMLLAAADFYEHQLTQWTERINLLVEPLLITGLGIIVGTIVIAMYLPIFQLGNTI